MTRCGSLFALLALLGGCTSFQNGRPLDAIPMPAPTTQRLEIWSAGERYQLHAVTVDADSLRGVRWWHSPECDSCRVALPRAAVDSVRTLRYDGGETGVLTLIVAPILFIGLAIVALSDYGGT